MYKKTATAPSLLRYEACLRKSQRAWQPLLKGELNIRAREIALIVAERMRNPDFVHNVAEQSKQQAIYPMNWSPQALGSGDLGVAFMYEYIDQCFPGQGWDAQARQYLGIAATATQQSMFIQPDLFGGASGMALVLSLASRGGQRYQKTLTRLHQGLCMQVLQQTWRRPDLDGGVAAHDYDVISGAAGVLAYLVSIEQPDQTVQATVEHVLAYLTWLAEPDQPVGKDRWYIPPALLPTDDHREATPQGNFNCGLAHGIPGPLAALALTWQSGYRYPGLLESIAYLANWVIEHHVNPSWGIDWPSDVPLEHASLPQDWQSLPPTRSAWCYGAPGVARSLWLAGQALDNEHLRQIAVEAIETVLRRPVTTRQIPSAHLCHGIAGLLQICLHFAYEGDSMFIREQVSVLAEQILDSFDPDFALGFRDLDQGSLDNPRWLTGAPGIAMAILAASTSVPPSWDRILVIA